MRRPKYSRGTVLWHCLNCQAQGKTSAKDARNLIRGIREHHHKKSPNCRFHLMDTEINPIKLVPARKAKAA